MCVNFLAALAFIGTIPALADDQTCSTFSLTGTYGFTVGAIVAPGTPRGVLGQFRFDGKGNWTRTRTMNDNGTITKVQDTGTYTVNADCTGTLFEQNAAKGTIEIVIVDGGNEFYELRTNPSTVVILFNAAKKQ